MKRNLIEDLDRNTEDTDREGVTSEDDNAAPLIAKSVRQIIQYKKESALYELFVMPVQMIYYQKERYVHQVEGLEENHEGSNVQ